jgi:hypothetical protein
MNPHIPKWTPMLGVWVPNGLPNFQSAIAGVKNSPPWKVSYIIGRLLKHICSKWSCIAHLDIWNTSYGQKKSRESNWQFNFRPLKIRNRPHFFECKQRATYRYKFFNRGYNFTLNLITIRGLHKMLCTFKITRAPIVGISKLPLGSPGTKNHFDVTPVESCKVYYKGWLPPSPGCGESCVSELPVARPNTKSVSTMHSPLCVGFMQVRVSDWSLSLLLSPIPELQHTFLPLYSATNQGACPDFLLFHCFQFGDSHLSPLGSQECVNGSPASTSWNK